MADLSRSNQLFGYWSTGSPEATTESTSAFIQPTFALDELIERLRSQFVLQRVPQDARPLGPRALIDFCWIGGAADDSGERVLVFEGDQGL